MKFLVIGAGGTGGCIGGYLAEAGKDVILIARGDHLRAIQEKGLTLLGTRRGDLKNIPVKATDGSGPLDIADVVFVCVKSYSVPGILPILRKACDSRTVVIPILNTLTTGQKLAEALPDAMVLDGCIYLNAFRSAPGVVEQGTKIFKVFYGPRPGQTVDFARLEEIRDELEQGGIWGIPTHEMQLELYKKFAFISAFASVGSYYNVAADLIQRPGTEQNDMFVALVKEQQALANAMGVPIADTFVEDNLKIIGGFSTATTTSMQRDIADGNDSEVDEAVFEVVRLGLRHGVPTPTYRKVADKFGFQEP